jgi:hypothetical protein
MAENQELTQLKADLLVLALGLAKALAADGALDQGDRARYQVLNAEATADVKGLLSRLGYRYSTTPHLAEGP